MMLGTSNRWRRWLGRWLGGRARAPSNAQGDPRRPLVVSRPPSLADSYHLVYDDHVAETLFQKLRGGLFDATAPESDVAGRTVGLGARAWVGPVTFREFGRLGMDRSFFFLQPQSELGFLFERSGPGWVIARAQKVAEGKYVREGESWDAVTLFMREGVAQDPRISSSRMGPDLVTLSVYRQRFLEALGFREDRFEA